MIPKNRRKNNKKKRGGGGGGAAMMGGEPKLSLTLFRPVEWPDVLPVKLKYDDFRAITAAGNQGLYVYRINSIFDPDFTGVGGQPGGFDQLKALYGRYRVMAFRFKIQGEVLTSGDSATLVAAPVDNSAFSTTAEALADLRHATNMSEMSFGAAKANIQGMWHVGELLGYSDESMLANSNMDAAVSANPAFQQYLFVAYESSGAATAVWLSVELEYYVRMETPIAVQDSVSKSKFARLRALPDSSLTSGAACGGAKSTAPALLASTQLQKVRQMLDGL